MTTTISVMTTSVIAEQLPANIPDKRDGGQPVSWTELKSKLEALGLGKLAGMAFGEPESMTRDGDTYTALGKRQAETVVSTGKGPVRVYSDKKVTFTLRSRGSVLYVSDVAGVEVEHTWIPFFSRRRLHDARVRMNGTRFEIEATAGSFPVRLTVDQNGTVD